MSCAAAKPNSDKFSSLIDVERTAWRDAARYLWCIAGLKWEIGGTVRDLQHYQEDYLYRKLTLA